MPEHTGAERTGAPIPAGRPAAGEYASWFAAYVARVPGEDPLPALERQRVEWDGVLAGLDVERGSFRYAPGKWSVLELAEHVVDTERILTTRALRIARGDPTPLPGFDQDILVAGGNAARRPPGDVREEFDGLRRSGLALFRGFDARTWRRTGAADGAPVSVRALAFIVAGHADHHLQVLRERYLR
ncbi:MAG: DinB family protein [Gemmatimonadota bacterium]|nr:DinB family protein [Gemmatimonadota bacterium]